MQNEHRYFLLFNAITDALKAIEAQNYGIAAEILKKAQQDGEESYIEEAVTGEKPIL